MNPKTALRSQINLNTKTPPVHYAGITGIASFCTEHNYHNQILFFSLAVVVRPVCNYNAAYRKTALHPQRAVLLHNNDGPV
jgi:hypothetical protein